MKVRALNLDDIRTAIELLPDESQRETATENMILVGLVARAGRGPR
jgi:hypothetical protein